MKKTVKKTLSILLCVIMLFMSAPLNGISENLIPYLSNLLSVKAAAASDYSGSCGEKLTYKFNSETGELKITGKGDMTDWDNIKSVPWYSFLSNISTVTIGSDVTSIGAHAFTLSGITKFVIPERITRIGDGAFGLCLNLENIVIPGNVKSIGDSVFALSSIDSITFSRGIKNIGAQVFSFCTKDLIICYEGSQAEWNDINIDSDNEFLSNTIRYNAFHGYLGSNNRMYYTFDKNTGLLSISGDKNVRIPDFSVGSSPWYPFRNEIKSVKIAGGAKSIGDYSFYNCLNLEDVTIPSDVTRIGKCAFYGCENINYMIVPKTVTTIDTNAFKNMEVSKAIYYEDTDQRWDVISNNSGISNFKIGEIHYKCFNGKCGDNLSYKFDWYNGVLIITGKGEMTKWSATDLAPWNSYNYLIKTVIMDDGITGISNYAFYECENLTGVIIPDGVTHIDNLTFGKCKSLEKITIPKSVENISPYAFYLCNKPFMIYYIGNNTDWNNIANNGLKNVTVNYEVKIKDIRNLTNKTYEYLIFDEESSTLTIIGTASVNLIYWLLSDYKNVKKVIIEPGITEIGFGAFADFRNMESITIPGSVTDIDDTAFVGCPSLSTIEVADDNMFFLSDSYNVLYSKCNLVLHKYPCGNANTEYTLPADVEYISENAFNDSVNLQKISVDKYNEVYDSRNDCNAIIEQTVETDPYKLTVKVVFGFKSTVLPQDVTCIAEKAFYGYNDLTSVIIPRNVNEISENAFYECQNIKNVYYDGTEEDWNSINIAKNNSCLKNAEIHYSVFAGKCGDHAMYYLDRSTGQMSINGSGNMYDRSDATDVPLYRSGYRKVVKSVTIDPGITNIGNYFFKYCENLKTAKIPDTIKSIGKHTFYSCSKLTEINIPNGIKNICEYAFSKSGLKEIFIPNSVTNIGDNAFFDCPNLISVHIQSNSNLTSIGSNIISGNIACICSPNDKCYAKTYAENNGYTFRICSEHEDTENPKISSFDSTNNQDTSQTVTFSFTDNFGVDGYYWGTDSDYNKNTYTSTSETSISFDVSSEGTYYLTAKDTSGNLSDTKSITFYKTTLNANGGSVSLQYILTKEGNSFTFPQPDIRNNYSYCGWSTSSTASEGKFTLTPTSNTEYFTVWSYKDLAVPVINSIDSTNSVNTSQEVTFSLYDNVGIDGYYWGTDSDYNKNTYTSTSETSISFDVLSEGTYYLTAKDTSGNLSDTKSITFYKTTLNANGGSVSLQYVLTKEGNSFTFPQPDIRKNYSYCGWSTESTESEGKFTLTPTSNTTYFIVWSYIDTIIPYANIIDCTNYSATTQTVKFSFSDNVGIAGYYWGTNSNYSSNAYTDTSSWNTSVTVTNAGTYYLTAKDTSGNISATKSITFYKIDLNANGGKVSPSYVLIRGGKEFSFPTPKRDNYQYCGWSTSSTATSGIKYLIPTKNTEYFAVWVDNINPKCSIKCTNNVAASQTVTFTFSDNVGVDGYYWGNNPDYSDNVYEKSSSSTVSMKIFSDGTYYIRVKDVNGNLSDNQSITFYKTELNANGGSVSPTSILTKSGNSFVFPKPKKNSCDYLGWSTLDEPKVVITELTPSSNSEYYAVWNYIDKKKPTCTIKTTNELDSKQTVTLDFSDDIGVAGYYWGKNPDYTYNEYVDIVNADDIEKTVSSEGTYYLTAKDTSGNLSDTKSITFYKTTLNANGGSVSIETILTASGNTFKFPTTTKTGYSCVGWSTSKYSPNGVESLTPVSNSTYYAIWVNAITVTVKNSDGSNAGKGISVFLYKPNSTLKKETDSKGTCVFTYNEYYNATSISACKILESKKGGSKRAAARKEYDNVIYNLCLTSDKITSTTSLTHNPFDGKDITLKLINPKIIYNCSVSYYYDKNTGDYYNDILNAFKYVNEYLKEATDGYVELGEVSIHSTKKKNDFYNLLSVAAKCDIQIRSECSDEWGSQEWPNATVNGAFNDDCRFNWFKSDYPRVQMQKISADKDISKKPNEWAKIVTHELGHYLFGFYDEYLNNEDKRWDDIGRPIGVPDNFGLMENEHEDLEMSVPSDYQYIYYNDEQHIPMQYYKHELSCWEFFKTKFFDPSGYDIILPKRDRKTLQENSNSVISNDFITFHDCQSALQTQASDPVIQEDKDTTLFVMTSVKNENIFLKTDEEITKCIISSFDEENQEEIIPEKVADGYQIPLSKFDENKNLLIVESEKHINTFDIYNGVLPEDEVFSNRNNSIFLYSNSSKNCGIIVYNNSNKNPQLGTLGRVVALNIDDGNEFTLVGRAMLNGKIDYSSLSWYKYNNGEWIKLTSNSSIGEYSSYETKCSVSESGIYALMATDNTAAPTSLPADKSYFSTESDNTSDGRISIKIDYSNKDVIGYRIQCQAEDKSETISTISSYSTLTLDVDFSNKKYNINVFAILNNGTEMSLGKTQAVLSGEYYEEGSKIPFWWVSMYELQEYENEIVDNKDYDNDGYSNLLEYLCGTNPRKADETPEISGTVISASIDDIDLKYKDSVKLNPKIETVGNTACTVEYKSSDTSVVTVDDNGNIYTKNKGSAIITCTVKDEYDNTVSDTCTVTVKLKWWQWIIRIFLLGFLWY